MMNKKIIVLFVFSTLVFITKAQEEKKLLRNIFRNMAGSYSGKQSDLMFYMSYSLHTVHADSLEKPTDVTIEVWRKNKLIEIKSAQMNVFQDEKDAFIMIPEKHLIMRNDASLKKQDEATVQQSMTLYDSLLNYCEVTKSLAEKGNGYDHKISIKINEKGQQLFKMKRVDYYINTTEKKVKKVRSYYTNAISAASRIAYVDYTINELQTDFKGKKLSENVSSHFLNDHQLKSNYKEYKLVDNRASVKKRGTYKE